MAEITISVFQPASLVVKFPHMGCVVSAFLAGHTVVVVMMDDEALYCTCRCYLDVRLGRIACAGHLLTDGTLRFERALYVDVTVCRRVCSLTNSFFVAEFTMSVFQPAWWSRAFNCIVVSRTMVFP